VLSSRPPGNCAGHSDGVRASLHDKLGLVSALRGRRHVDPRRGRGELVERRSPGPQDSRGLPRRCGQEPVLCGWFARWWVLRIGPGDRSPGV